MASSLKSTATICLLFVLFFSTEMGPMMLGESEKCDDTTKLCMTAKYCTKWCKKRGYERGRCFELNCCCFPEKKRT
nr:defensin-like protein [Ipomoea batatas]GMD16704.1 defensin-like protein [Ipomoea batatas]GMD20992.1 defensin-like protein [Ipomoea batatas]